MEKDPDLTDAMNYLNRVKEEYKEDITIYDHFLELMRDYKNGKNDAIIIVRAVEQLFKGKKYLIDGFANFLPRCMSDRIDQRKGYGGNNHERHIPERHIPERHIPERHIPERHIPERHISERHISERHIPERHIPERMPIERHISERMPNERIKERVFDRPISERVPEKMYERVENPERHEKGGVDRMCSQEGKDKTQVPFYFDDTNKQKRALQFVHKVKRRFANMPDTYKEFIRVLQIYQKNPTNGDRILNQLKSLLSGHDDLLRDFVHFVPNNLSFINEILKQKDLLQPFTKLLNMYNQNCISPKDFLFLMKNILNNDRLLDALATFINYKDEGEEVPVRKLKKIGSYRIYPEEMRNVDCLEQSNIAKAVLNNFCMISAFGSEETTFLASRKNAYEEILYKIEDERYECEMNVFRIGDFIVSLEELFERMSLESKLGDGDENFIEFTIQDINMPAGIVQEVLSIVYRDKAIDILEGILSKPQISIPIVLKRLYLVYNRLKGEINEKNKLWREVTVKNIYKARECTFKRERGIETYAVTCVDDFVSLYNDFSKVTNCEGKDIFEKVIGIIKEEAKFSFYASTTMAAIIRLVLEVSDCLHNLKIHFDESRKVIESITNEKKVCPEAKSELITNEKKSCPEAKSEFITNEKKVFSEAKSEEKTDEGVVTFKDELESTMPENNSRETRKDVFYETSSNNIPERMDIEDCDTEEVATCINNKEIPKRLNLLPAEEEIRNDLSKKNYDYLLTIIKQNLTGELENQEFEDTLRLITDSKGQRIYNIEKTMLKIDKYCSTLRTENGSMQLLSLFKRRIGRYAAEVLCDDERVYLVTKNDIIQIKEVDGGDENLREVVRFFIENDERDEKNVYADYGLEIVVDKDYKIKYVENTNDFVMRKGKKRLLNSSIEDKK